MLSNCLVKGQTSHKKLNGLNVLWKNSDCSVVTRKVMEGICLENVRNLLSCNNLRLKETSGDALRIFSVGL